jgi:hypothetical protein
MQGGDPTLIGGQGLPVAGPHKLLEQPVIPGAVVRRAKRGQDLEHDPLHWFQILGPAMTSSK